MNKYPNLFSPIKIGNLTFKNRITVAPVSVNDHNEKLHLADNHIALYGKKAMGDASVVTLGEANVDDVYGIAQDCIALYDKAVIPSLKRVTDAIHSGGALSSIELNHGGIFSDLKLCKSDKIYGPSEMELFGNKIHQMPEKIMIEIAEAFGKAALNAKYGGFDMVMLHGGHGWLLSNFLCPLHNKRTDKYGGSIRNRTRFIKMIISSIKEKCGNDYPIEFRMSGDEFLEGGYTIEDGIEIAKELDGKVELFHISACNFIKEDAGSRMFPSFYHDHGVNVYMAEKIKKAVNTPVAVVGSISDPKKMEEIISTAKADVVAIARAISADPYLPEKIRTGNESKIRPCIRCNYCISSRYEPFIKHPSMVLSRCAVNPSFGRETETYFPSGKSKKVMVVGGGPSGMQAAITASECGHKVSLYEKSNKLGGMLNNGVNADFKSCLKKYRDYLVNEVNNQNIDVYFNTNVNKELVGKVSPDVLIIAVGSKAFMPNIDGVNSKNVINLNEINDSEIGDNVVIIGGGLSGTEEGLYLAKQGKRVSVLEREEKNIAIGTYLQWEALEDEMTKHNIEIKYSHNCLRITDDCVIAEDKDSNKVIFNADTIIIATGFIPLEDVVDSLRSDEYKCFVVGDCNKVSNVMNGVTEAYLIAKNL